MSPFDWLESFRDQQRQQAERRSSGGGRRRAGQALGTQVEVLQSRRMLSGTTADDDIASLWIAPPHSNARNCRAGFAVAV